MNAELREIEGKAKALLASFQAGAEDAIERVHQHLPQVQYRSREAARDFPLTLSEAQTVIARENGMKSWGELRLAIKLAESDYGEALEQFKSLVYAGDAEKLDALLTAHPELRATIDDPHFYFGSTALIVGKQNLELVDVLLKHGADINTKSQWWAGDFHVLEVTPADVAQQLIERGAIITVHAAAEQGWLDWLEAAYQRDPAIVHLRGGDGKTPLHYASDPAIMDWLLARGADLEARDLDHESTPLQWQLGEHNIDVARELIRRGAQVDLFAAVMLGDLDLVARSLAQHPEAIRARVNYRGYELVPRADGSHQYVYAFNAAGLSPHQVAVELGQDEIFAYLVEESPPDVRLLAYCAAGDGEMARRIAQAEPGLVSALDESDQRQLINAAWTGKAEVVRLMASLGFNLHVRDDDAMTPLHSAAFHGFADVIAILLEADDEPPLDWLNGYGGTPLTTSLYGRGNSWRSDGDFLASLKRLVEAGSEVREDWLPTGDDALDAILRAGL